MADVTSTARLIVTVEGEGKIAALAAQLKALKALGGSTRVGAGGGVGLAQQMATRRAIATVGKQQAGIAKQQSGLTKQLATVSATQAVTGKLLAPMAAQQRTTAKLIAPLAAQQATLAKTVKPLAAGQAAIARVQQQWLAGRAMAARGARTPSQPPAPSGVTPGLMKSILERSPHLTAAQVAAAQAAPTIFPPSAAMLKAQAKAAKAAAKAAAAAQPPPPTPPRTSAGRRGGLRAPPVVPPVGPVLGPVARAAGLGAAGGVFARGAAAAAPLAGAVGALAVGFKAASSQAEELVTNQGRALKSRREIDEVEARRAAGEAVFGKGYETLEKRLPKLLSDQRAKRGIAGEKGLFARMGIDPAAVAKMEKAGKRLDTYDIGEIFAKKREQLEGAVAAAKTPKAAQAAQKKLDQFWKDVGLFGPEMVRATAFGSEALKNFRENQQQIQQAYGAGLADEKTQLRQAQANVLARANVGNQFKESMDRVGTIAMPGVNKALDALNTKMLDLGPAVSGTLGHFSRLGWEGIASSINSIDSSKFKTAMQDLQTMLAGETWETLDLSKVATGIGKALGAAFEGVDFSESIGKLSTKLGESIPDLLGTAVEGAFTAMAENIGKGIDNMMIKWLPESMLSEEQIEEKRKRAADAAAKKAEEDAKKAPPVPPQIKPQEELSPEEYERRLREAAPPLRRVDVQADNATITTPSVPLPTPKPPGITTPAVPAVPAAAAPLPVTQAPSIVPDVQPLIAAGTQAGTNVGTAAAAGITSAGSQGGAAFSQAASAGITAAGAAGGAAFNAAVNGSAIGSAIGSAAAAIISSAKVSVDVSGAVAAAGGGRGAKPSNGGDKAATSGSGD
jgi:hypothetical protein